MASVPKTCVSCNQAYIPKQRLQLYCSPECQRTEYNRQHGVLPRLPKTCVYCNEIFSPRTSQQRYCSSDCRRAGDEPLRWQPLHPGIDKGKVGAVVELIVSADLLRRGYEVFRALSQSASCDILAMKDGAILRIEVRSCQLRRDGGVIIGWKPIDIGRQDVFATVLPSGEVAYRTKPHDGGSQYWEEAIL